jgi:hypothetical protein
MKVGKVGSKPMGLQDYSSPAAGGPGGAAGAGQNRFHFSPAGHKPLSGAVKLPPDRPVSRCESANLLKVQLLF